MRLLPARLARRPDASGVSGGLRAALPVVSAFVLLSFLAVTPADADLWGHLKFGADIARTGFVHTGDPYSFTSDRPWVNHEWLAEVTMWRAYELAGPRGLVALKLLLACLAALAVLEAWRPHDFPPMRRDALLFAAAVGTWPQLQAMRPQVFSIALFAWLLFVLARLRAGRLRWLAALPPLFALWVNLHGGWIVGALALLAFVACSLFDRGWSARRKAAVTAVAATCGLATLCNPYGSAMLAFLGQTVRPDRADIAEWHPITATGPFIIAIWVASAALAAAAIWRKRRVPASSAIIVLMVALGSLRVARLLGFFTVAVAMLLVPYLQRARDQAFASGIAPRGPGVRGRAQLVAAGVLPFSLALAFFGGRLPMNGAWYPEPEAASVIAARGLRGRMLTWFDYGEYAIWHFSPGLRVSMDGRRETVYGDDVRDLHWRIYANAPSALDDVARLNPDHAWLPRASAVVPVLEAHGWHPLFEGPRSVVLSRTETGPLVRVTGPVAPRAFPGP